MRIEYRGTLLDQVLDISESRAVEFVYLNPDEFDEVFDEASKRGTVGTSGDYWFTVENHDIVFYLEEE